MGFLGVFQLPGVDSNIKLNHTCWLVAHTLMIKQPQETPMKNSPNFQTPKPRGNRDFNSAPKIPWIISSSARGLPKSSHIRMRSVPSFLGPVCWRQHVKISMFDTIMKLIGSKGVKPFRYRPTNRLSLSLSLPPSPQIDYVQILAWCDDNT